MDGEYRMNRAWKRVLAGWTFSLVVIPMAQGAEPIHRPFRGCARVHAAIQPLCGGKPGPYCQIGYASGEFGRAAHFARHARCEPTAG